MTSQVSSSTSTANTFVVDVLPKKPNPGKLEVVFQSGILNTQTLKSDYIFVPTRFIVKLPAGVWSVAVNVDFMVMNGHYRGPFNGQHYTITASNISKPGSLQNVSETIHLG